MEMEVELSSAQRRIKGGLVTMPFIIANEALARVATLGLLPNMVLYLMGNYNLHLAKATHILLLSVATTNFTPLPGAFIADSYLGRFLSVGLGSIITFLGMVLLWLTAMIPQARPPPCNPATERCKSATTGQMALLISSLALMSIGNGGLSCSLAFGADQLNRKDNPNNQRALEMFFSWYYASSAISVIIAFTGIVYIQDHLGWKLGFGVPAALMFLSTFFFFLASPIYVKNQTHGSLLTSFARVIVVAYKNRKLRLPLKNSAGMYHLKKDSDLVVPTDKLRFLNKACFIKDPEKDIAPDGTASNPRSLCTIDQVEELKAIIKVIPLWSSGIMMSLNIGGSFGLLQAKSLNRHITPNFEVPAGSLSVIMIFTIFLWIALYDRVIIPLASKLRGKPVRISAKRRMGIGLFFSFLHLVTAAMVETTRRRRAIREGYINNTHAVLNMSAMWLFPQLCLGGIAEAFNVIGQNEFYYTEFPKSMSSIASSLFGLGMAVGYVVSSLVFKIVENVTSRGGKDGWVSDNINKGRFDKYYWLLATLSAVNILYYLVCSWAYGPTSDQESKMTEENGSNEEELPLIELETEGVYDKTIVPSKKADDVGLWWIIAWWIGEGRMMWVCGGC
ncbi:protein NRT1/ PTR FAMILY 1.2-like isoform X1 [Gastrolobium bilobum]|uniref:protein NRT1/ PTR FAMILY 1.2-like isoform X1 n=2 Tax=Gastrolobium bilobum TaxID=150636 RepID=UPI002AB0F0E3|nr:protein NRT1/ PTR FAMILY 1.2-like isoform X1 [Gastrolobium bilobum]XP_061367505.1 protein NRT1/ PTR FAMILY 1.2-like isoform X1 [Gastrolobium bilobum]